MERVLNVMVGNYAIGAVYKYAQGFQFRAFVSGRKGSRKFYSEANSAIPAWAKKQATDIVAAA